MRHKTAVISKSLSPVRRLAYFRFQKVWLWVLVWGTVSSFAIARGQSFENLDFEMGLPGFISVDSALPYWTAKLGDVIQTEVLSPQLIWGQAAIMMAWYSPPYVYPMEGDLSVYLIGAGGTNAVLEQTGLVPIEARSLRFRATLGGTMEPSMEFYVTLGGQAITLYSLGTGQYGGNLSGQTGSVATLAFTAVSSSSGQQYILGLDSIYFSSDEIPLGPARPASISRVGTNIVLRVTHGIGASWCNIERLNDLTGTSRWTKIESFSPPGLGTYLWITPALNFTAAFFRVSTEYPIPGF